MFQPEWDFGMSDCALPYVASVLPRLRCACCSRGSCRKQEPLRHPLGTSFQVQLAELSLVLAEVGGLLGDTVRLQQPSSDGRNSFISHDLASMSFFARVTSSRCCSARGVPDSRQPARSPAKLLAYVPSCVHMASIRRWSSCIVSSCSIAKADTTSRRGASSNSRGTASRLLDAASSGHRRTARASSVEFSMKLDVRVFHHASVYQKRRSSNTYEYEASETVAIRDRICKRKASNGEAATRHRWSSSTRRHRGLVPSPSDDLSSRAQRSGVEGSRVL